MKNVMIFLLILVVFTACTPRKQVQYSKKDSPVISANSCPLVTKNISILKNKKKAVRILSIDGGGVKGIIPARIVAEFENRSGKPACELFDLMVGTSTGGLVVLALATPNESGQPKYKASDILDLYMQKSKDIFYASMFRKIYTGFGLWGPKYDRSQYDKILIGLFGNTRMSQLISPTAVTSYNLDTNLPQVWTRKQALKDPNNDFLISNIAAASSAAPIFFAPKLLTNAYNNSSYQVDGGMFASNPELTAANLAYELDDTLTQKDIVLISLGTGLTKLGIESKDLCKSGVIGWILKANLISGMMQAQGLYNAELGEIYGNSCRLQFELDKKTSAMDNASKANLLELLKLTEDYISTNSDLIDQIISILLNTSPNY